MLGVFYWILLLLWVVLDVWVLAPPDARPTPRRGLGILLFLLFVFIGIKLWGNPFSDGPPR